MEAEIQFIREVCIKSNPEIVELKFGCEIKRGGMKTVITLGGKNPKKVFVRVITGERLIELSEIDEIIGRPIRLADVLLAINGYGKDIIAITEAGTFLSMGNAPSTWEAAGADWNIKQDDLSLQSKETVEFISNLLKSE